MPFAALRSRLEKAAAKRQTSRHAARTSGGPQFIAPAWIDEFWRDCGQHIFVREEDAVLILPPNRVYKLNPTGARLIAFLKAGGHSKDFGLPSQEALDDTTAFFNDLACLYRGEAAPFGSLETVHFELNFTSLPILAEVALTYRCNNACLFCYAGCAGGTSQATAARPELDTAGFKAVIDCFAREARVPFFSFTGGEPTLRDDLEELIAYAASLGLITNLVTNGTLIDCERARDLKAAGLGSAQVSIEAPDAPLHDYLVGRAGAFEDTVAGIRALVGAGVPTQTNTTISNPNRGQVAALPAFLKTLGVRRFAMNLFIPTIEGPYTKELFLPYDEIGPIVEEVRAAARCEDLTFYWYSPTPFCSYNPIAQGLGNKSCAAADGLLSVAPDGEVLPCSSWDLGLGKLTEEPFRAIWDSPAARACRNKDAAPAICKTCPSFTACQGACPLYWRHAGTALIENSCPARHPACAEGALHG